MERVQAIWRCSSPTLGDIKLLHLGPSSGTLIWDPQVHVFSIVRINSRVSLTVQSWQDIQSIQTCCHRLFSLCHPMYSDQGFSDAEIAYQLAHINETKAPSIVAAVAVLSVLATIAIVLRAFVRWQMKSDFLTDDYTLFCAWVYILNDGMA